jgi:hypothetical protein
VRCHAQRRNGNVGELFRPAWKWLSVIAPAAVLFIGVFEIYACAPARAALPSTLGDHYLMLVNTAMANQMDAQKMAQFDRSPYDGLAVSFSDAYDAAPVPTFDSMETQVASWKKFTRKDIWPWVYLNRMVGANNDEGNSLTKVPYFQKFRGLDLDGKAGAQKDFLENWRNALGIPRKTGVPGVVCDLEFYNNYKADDLGELSRMTSMPRQDVLRALAQVGARMADIAAQEYPGATLWILFTGFTRPDYRIIDGQPYYLADTYIADGLLDQIQRHHYSLHVLSGGEVGLGYCHASVEDLHQTIEKRAAAFAPLLQKYSGILDLAGTMTLWSDKSAKKNWVAQGACGASTAETVEDLVPYMELLFHTYRYNWIYGSPNGGYLAFQSASAPRFDAAISKAKARANGAPGRQPIL